MRASGIQTGVTSKFITARPATFANELDKWLLQQKRKK